jgi:uncharacterized LabA/DUF88 family protein
MVFVDNSNIFRGSLSLGIKVDYQKMVDFLSNGAFDEKYDLLRVIMYCTVDRSKSEDQIRAQEWLYDKFNSFHKFDVKKFTLKTIRDGNGNVIEKYEKGVDTALVTDLLLLATKGAFDVAIVCAGDADFIKAIEGVKDMGIQIYVASFDHSCSKDLKSVSLGYVSLTNNCAKFTY